MAEKYDRNAEARSLGFRNYYEVRIRGGIAAARAGRITPDTPRPEGRELAARRGHAGIRDLLRDIRPGYSAKLSSNIRYVETDSQGDFVSIPITITTDDGEDRDYWLTNISDDDLERLLDEFEDNDVDYDTEPGSTNIGALIGR